MLPTDVVDNELTRGQPDDLVAERLEQTRRRYEVEILGPNVPDMSRLDHSVCGSDEDTERLDRVFELIYPHSDRSNERHLFDAMAVATAIRYGEVYFVTSDKQVLKSADRIRAEFHRMQLMAPAKAVEFVERMINVWEATRNL